MDAAEGLMNLGTAEARDVLQSARATLSASESEGASSEELLAVIDEALSHFGAADVASASEVDAAGADRREDK